MDFTNGVAAAHGRENPYDDPENWGQYSVEKLWAMAPEEFWSPLNNLDFWEGLDPTPECFDILEYLEGVFGEKQVCILTSPSRDPASVAGKALWIAKHIPNYSRRFLIGAQKHLCAHPRAVLVDDSDYKITRFVRNGGIGVLFARPWNSYSNHADDPVGFMKHYMEDYHGVTHDVVGVNPHALT